MSSPDSSPAPAQSRFDIIDIPVEGGVMPAHRWLPESGSGPGILLLQEIFGISDYIERRASDLAALGYVVVVPEIYWRLGTTRVEDGPAALDEAMGLVSKLDWDAAVADATAALTLTRDLPEVTGPTALVGFCFGGGLGFATAAQELPDALVSYYGSAIPGLLDLAPQVTCPQLHHFGLADSYIPPETVAAIEQAVAGPHTEFFTYEGADHAFDNSDFVLHHPAATALAWQRTTDFLERTTT